MGVGFGLGLGLGSGLGLGLGLDASGLSFSWPALDALYILGLGLEGYV